jgi:hypothetical protein
MPKMSSKLARMEPRRDAWTMRISFLISALLCSRKSWVSKRVSTWEEGVAAQNSGVGVELKVAGPGVRVTVEVQCGGFVHHRSDGANTTRNQRQGATSLKKITNML